MIDFIQSIIFYEFPPKDSIEYRDIVFKGFLITTAFLLIFAFFDDMKKFFKGTK